MVLHRYDTNIKKRLQSKKKGELNNFLSEYYNTNLEINNKLKWEKIYENLIEITGNASVVFLCLATTQLILLI